MKFFNKIAPVLASTSFLGIAPACAPKKIEPNHSGSEVHQISNDLREKIIEIQNNSDDNGVGLNTTARATYMASFRDADMPEFLDNNLVSTINPCDRDDAEMKNLIEDLSESTNPWEVRRVFLENLASQPGLHNAFKKTSLYANLVHEYSTLRCKQPSLTFYVNTNERLIARLKFCNKIVEEDITDLKLSSNLDWLRDHESGTCDDKVLVFPYEGVNSFQLERRGRDDFIITSGREITEGDLTILYPQLVKARQNISNYHKAIIDIKDYYFNYVNPSLDRLIDKEKKTLSAQRAHVKRILNNHFDDHIAITNVNLDSFDIRIDTQVLRIKIDSVESDQNQSYLYKPSLLDCKSTSDCDEVDLVDINLYSESSLKALSLKELVWWLDTNFVYTYMN